MAGPISHYLKNKIHSRAIYTGTYVCSDLMALEGFISNPPKTAQARAEFTALKKSHRTHYKELVKELKNEFK